MDKWYELYCLVDPLFYDSPVNGARLDFEQSGRPAPEDWSRVERDDWVVYRPIDAAVPDQGWKIHASACLDNSPEVLDFIFDYCISRNIPFKFLRAKHLLHLRNAKYADRGASGKLAAIYPADEAQLQTVTRELATLLDGHQGPYILSDLRIGAGPLYVRYGGIAERYCVSEQGRVEPAIADPDGNLVPDKRGPVFATPPWVTLPAFLAPDLEARRAVTLDGVPYTIESVLHFSNGGGVYAGKDTGSGRRVVLKEARPHAGLDFSGDDAVTRLWRERDALTRLAGLEAVPELLGEFAVGEHHFIAMEHVDGLPLNRLFGERYPLGGQSSTDLAEYTAWVIDLCAKVEKAVAAIHERGLIFGDVHLSNVMVRPDGSVVLIDYEMATPIEDADRTGLANPAFAAPHGVSGTGIDRHALACLRFAMFLPLTELFLIDRAKGVELAEVIAERFPVPAEFLEEAVEVVGGGRKEKHLPAWHGATLPDPERWERLRRSMANAILASATPERDDRLFPGDVEQFATGGLNLAHGAAGVLYALDVTGAGRFPEHEQWLIERAMTPREGSRLGFYDGLHGVAHTLARLGREQQALELVAIITRERWETLGLDLHGGLAGIGLNLLHLEQTTGERDLGEQSLKVADLVAGRLEESARAPYAGLMNGSSGPALFFLRLYERTGDRALLDLAERALRQDLRRCRKQSDGSLQIDEGWRTMPYLDRGSVGLAWVLGDYLRHRPDEELAAAFGALDLAARSPFYIQSGLFTGRAGVLAYLARRGGADPEAEVQLRALGWHAIRHEAHIAFPGERLLRLSMDLATGTAGVLLAVGAALHDKAAALPFLSQQRMEV